MTSHRPTRTMDWKVGTRVKPTPTAIAAGWGREHGTITHLDEFKVQVKRDRTKVSDITAHWLWEAE
jgi:hypothetical protein